MYDVTIINIISMYNAVILMTIIVIINEPCQLCMMQSSSSSVYKASVFSASVYDLSVYDAYVYDASVYDVSVYDASVHNLSVYDASAYDVFDSG